MQKSHMNRRTFIHGCLATPLIPAGCQRGDPFVTSPVVNDVHKSNDLRTTSDGRESQMYGLIAKLSATEGNREKLIELLLAGTKDMPGCRLYAISADVADENGIWITEIWESEEFHQASLQLPSVQKAIAEGKPFIAGFGERHLVTPVGGIGVGTA